MGASLSPQRMRLRPDARPLSPPEISQVRAFLRKPEIDSYLDAAEVAKRLGLNKRTVLLLAHAGAFDGEWGKAFKPAHNRLRIPVKGVDAYIAAHAAHEEGV